MKVLFLQHVAPYRKGDVADVSAGYAHNFLIPKKLAILAHPQVIAEAAKQKAQQANASRKEDDRVHSVLRSLDGKIIEISAETSPSGTLYAALQPKNVASALANAVSESFPERLMEQLPSIKHAGQHKVILQYLGQTATFTLIV